MTDTSTTLTERIGQFPRGDRAMVPLAVLGVVFLLVSVLLVGYVETRDEPEPEIDAQRALDQTEANVQTVVRDSAQRATELAATQPMTAGANTEWGAVLNGSANGLADDPFRNYVRALVYLEIQEDLVHAGHERGAVETNVTVPNVTGPDDFADAIRRVRLTDNKTELGITLSNVTITATYDGTVIEQRETTIAVTIVTPLLQLHDRVSAYQHAIDEAPVYERGFSQRFNARVYAIGWARGWAQNYRAPVAEVFANRHAEPSANAALYRTQQDIFGAADPALKNAVRLGWFCMALRDGEAMFDEYMSDRGGLEYGDLAYDPNDGTVTYNDSIRVEVPENISDGLCSGAHMLFDQLNEKQPPAPGPLDLIGGTNLLSEPETVDIGRTAHLPFVEMVDPGYQHSFERAIQRIFTIEGGVEADLTVDATLNLDKECPTGYRAGPVSRDPAYNIETTERTPVSESAESYYRYESEITVTVLAKWDCYNKHGDHTTERVDSDRYVLDVTTTVGESEANPAAKIDELNPDSEIDSAYKYNPGPSDWGASQFANYDGVEENVTAGVVGGVDRESHEQWLETRLTRTRYAEGPPSQDVFETTETVELDYGSLLDDFDLRAKMADDVLTLQETTAAVGTEFERRELVTGNPMEQLRAELDATVRDEYINESSSFEYDNVGEKALYEARYRYYLTVVERLTELENAHDVATAELTDRISNVDPSLGNATQFLRQGIREDEPEPESFVSSDLTGDVSYEVSGSPTYLLSTETVGTDRVPPVETDVEFAPLAAKNTNIIDMPYEDVINDLLTRLAEWVPGPDGTPDAEITLRMAGDVLAAGERALQAQEAAAEAGRNDTYLDDPTKFETDLDRFEENLVETLDTFENRVINRTLAGVYPSPVTECILSDNPLDDDRYPGWETCQYVSKQIDNVEETVIRARGAVETGVRNALEPYDTAETALLIGEGNGTDYIIENVTRELGDLAEYGYEEFAENYSEDQWGDLIDSAVRPAVRSASALSVEIGSVEQAEQLDRRMQAALGNATDDLVAERVEHVSEQIGETVDERWLGNVAGTKRRAARVPAGLPILPIPGKWIATANAWDIEVKGEYARFEVSATIGTPAETTGMTYVRENTTVSLEIAGEERELGSVEEIGFDTRTVLIVVTPPGVGVGDRDSTNPECSPTYPQVGPIDSDQESECTHPLIVGG